MLRCTIWPLPKQKHFHPVILSLAIRLSTIPQDCASAVQSIGYSFVFASGLEFSSSGHSCAEVVHRYSSYVDGLRNFEPRHLICLKNCNYDESTRFEQIVIIRLFFKPVMSNRPADRLSCRVSQSIHRIAVSTGCHVYQGTYVGRHPVVHCSSEKI